MLKKIITFFMLLAITAPAAFARIGQPSFVFAIDRNPVAGDTPAGGNTGHKDGLSGGAVTAITLGSIGGAALLGLGGWLYKRKTAQCLTPGGIRGNIDPLIPFCIEKNPDAEFYARINRNYPYLQKALSLNEIHYCPNSKYILIYDTPQEKRTYDTVKFNLPAGVKSIKITHVTDPFKNGDLTTELFFTSKNVQSEIDVLKDIKNETELEGVIIKTVPADTLKYDSAVNVITNYTEKKIYRILFEFVY